MFWHREGKPADRPSSQGEHLVEECEAFLEGRWANMLQAFEQPVPPLAWLNLLAHGSLRDITTASRWAPSSSVTAMTAETLRVARSKNGLRELQSAALIPLELALLGSEDAASLDSQMLLSSVVEAVECFRQGC